MANEATSSKTYTGNKFKNDIRLALGTHLIKKNYLAEHDKYKKSELNLTQTKDQFIFNSMVDADISRRNPFLYSSNGVSMLHNSSSTIDIQFSKFVKFVLIQSDDIKTELSKLFGPIIAHLYIEHIKGRRDYNIAFDFLKKNAELLGPVESAGLIHEPDTNGLFSSEADSEDDIKEFNHILYCNEESGDPIREYFKNIIQILSLCLSCDELEISEEIDLFRSSKYELGMSLEAVEVLRKYLETDGHVLILNILNAWIHFNILGLNENDVTEDDYILNMFDTEEQMNGSEEIEDEKNESFDSSYLNEEIEEDIENESNDTYKNKSQNIHTENLKQCIIKLNNTESPVRYFKISDLEQSLTCASLDNNECHLLAGFNSSILKIWQLNENNLCGKNFYSKINNKLCAWDINNFGNDEETEFCSSDEDFLCRKQTTSKTEIPGYYGGVIVRGHRGGVTSAAFSKHYPIMLSVSKDKTMKAWSSNSFDCSATYKGHNFPIWCLSESPISSYVCTGSRDNTARLWSLERQQPLITYIGHTQDVDAVNFHPNGNYLATGSSDLSVRLWCVTTGKLFRVFSDCKSPITNVAFSPNGKYLAASGEESKIRIFDLAGGSLLSEIKDNSNAITSITWNHEGTKLASSCADGTVKIWDTNNLMTTVSTNNKILNHLTDCSRVVKLFFNKNDSLTCVGSFQ